MSGERQAKDPEKGHKARYQFISKFVKPNDRILDVFCGSGYGSDILLTTNALHVTAFDKFNGVKSRGRFTFVHSRYPAVQFHDNSFDFIALLEGIEHISDRMGANLLLDIRHWLSPKGQLFISTPNGDRLTFNHTRWPYHKLHYTPEYMENTLEMNGLRIVGRWNQEKKGDIQFREGLDGDFMLLRCVHDRA